MTTIDPQTLIGMIQVNTRVIYRQTNGLTHEDSLLQLPFRGNCMNWVLGHMVEHRDRMLKILGEAPQWDADQSARYASRSEPILPDSDAERMENLLRDLQAAQERIVATLGSATPESLAKVMDGEEQTDGERLHFLLWHETYHLGQTEILRQLAGTDDKVI